MIKKLRTLVVTAVTALTLTVVPIAVAGHVAADTNNLTIGNCVSQGTSGNGSLSGDCTGDASNTGNTNGTDLTSIIKLVVNVISIVVGVIAVIMIIWGGMKYITSGGESGKITSAKNTIIYALIGLVIVALAQFIVKFVLAKTTDITN